MGHRVIINGQKVAECLYIWRCWEVIEEAYKPLGTGDALCWEVQHTDGCSWVGSNHAAGLTMERGSWEALCEEVYAFKCYCGAFGHGPGWGEYAEASHG